jgi:hypothetical protein
MKLNKVLHPETVLNLRGNEKVRQYYAATVGTISFVPGGGMTASPYVKSLNPSERRGLALMRRWQLDSGKVYHVASDFLLAIADIERGVSLEYLPDRFVGYISFADATIYDDVDEVNGAYVYVGPQELTPLKPGEDNPKILWIAYMCETGMSMGAICVDLHKGDTLDAILSRIEDDNFKKSAASHAGPNIIPPTDLKKRSQVHNAVLNVVMYLHSQEPNVQRVPGSLEISNRKASELAARTGLRNECLIPVTFVNWNYAKQRQQNIDSTWVNTHLRWQKCGQNFSQVKLIWVRPHKREYVKDGNASP